MTEDDVIRITRSLRVCELTSKPKRSIHYSLTLHQMFDLFKIVATEERERMIYAGPHEWAKEALLLEREACAEVCDYLYLSENSDFYWIPEGRSALKNAAKIIRARKINHD
jgi:hypothetical protein